MANVYDALVHFKSLDELVTKHNRLVNSLGKDLSTVVTGGGVGDVKSPIVPGVIDDTVVLYDGISGKRIKSSAIYASWFDQDVSMDADVEFRSVYTTEYVGTPMLYLDGVDGGSISSFLHEDGDISLETYITDSELKETTYNYDTDGELLVRSIDLDTGETTIPTLASTTITVGTYILPNFLDGLGGPGTALVMTEMTGLTIDDTWRDWVPEDIALVEDAVYQLVLSVGEGANRVVATGQFVWSALSPMVEWNCEVPLHQVSSYATGGKNIYVRTACDGANPMKLQMAGSTSFVSPVVNAKFVRIL